MFLFDPPENFRKPKVFRCFPGDQKGTLGRKVLMKDYVNFIDWLNFIDYVLCLPGIHEFVLAIFWGPSAEGPRD